MKRTVLLTTALMMFLAVSAQNDKMTREQADKLDSVTVKLMNQQHYEDAIKTKERELNILKTLYGEKDSTYIRQLAFSAKLYFRNKQPQEAARIIEEAAQLYADNLSNSDETYAFYLDNLSLYQLTTEDYPKAKENCRKALTIYEKLGKQDYDLAIILMHMAEASNYCDETNEAVKYELRALTVISKVHGKHSDEYIDELPYLKKYYLALDDQKNAKEVEETISRLKQEKEDGIVDLPQPMEFKTKEICKEHNADALKCIKYYLTHKLSAPQMNQAAQYIINWSDASDDVTIHIEEEIGSLMSTKHTMAYFIAYLASYSYFCLKENTKTLDRENFSKCIDVLLQFYEPNSELSGKADLLEKYLNLQKKGKLEKELDKLFDSLNKE